MNYKYASESGKWFYQIDDNGLKSQSFTEKNKPGLYKEMTEWLKNPGNEIEPFETQDEIDAREAKEQEASVAAQKTLCLRLLNATQHKLDGDYRYPSDVPAWITWRGELKDIIEGTKSGPISDPPFSTTKDILSNFVI